MLVGLIHPDPLRREEARGQLPERLATISGGDLLELACSIANVVNPKVSASLGRHCLGMTDRPEVIVLVLAAAWDILRGWPHTFETLIVNRINRHPALRQHGIENAHIKILSRYETSKRSATARERVLELIARMRAATKHGTMAKQVVIETGAHMGTLVALRRSGEIPSELTMAQRRLIALLVKQAVANMAKPYRPRERLVSASWMLGIPTYSLRELVDRALITAALHLRVVATSLRWDRRR